MIKEEAVKWMLEEGLAGNEFSAGHVWDGLELWKSESEKQKELVRSYRKWRKISNRTKYCFAAVLEGLNLPEEYEINEEPKEEPKKKFDQEKILKELGF